MSVAAMTQSSINPLTNISASPLSLSFKVLDERVRPYIPRYATEGSAGLDLCALLDEPLVIEPSSTHRIRTGLAVHIANTHIAGIIIPRSGLGTKYGIVLANLVGLIDSDYQGELQIACWNRGTMAYTLQPFERLAQFVLVPVLQAELKEVSDFETLSTRGTGGFGSTGQH